MLYNFIYKEVLMKTINISDELHEKLKNYCDKTRRTLAKEIDYALHQYLTEIEKHKEA
jgi:predicted DNA-binding protein